MEEKTVDLENDMLVQRSWGLWIVLARGPGFKIKRLVLSPKQTISLQYHNHRSETWCIVDGSGKALVAERKFDIKKHDSFYIPIGVTHKVWNTSSTRDLVIIEVQQGEILREDDIVRLDENK